ncbi:retrovirus-related pol polyprotein from transposon TNT 1-94 [Tanacetum coccineum]|uniref:Retrovirus-related pol polyprotein from transposon TNT 1-94 n=1 Tax=Tanacetum coccineum TaxID=301880 RepID=A0ABQ4Y221_9ASTR
MLLLHILGLHNRIMTLILCQYMILMMIIKERNQVVIQDGRVDIQSKNVGYAGNGSRNSGRNPRTIANTRKTTTVLCYNCNKKGHYTRECSKPRVRDSKYFREHMLLATKDGFGIHLDEEENDFMFMSASGEEQLEELNASVIMLARIQPTDSDSDVEPTYNFDFVSEVNASQIDLIRELFSKINHEQRNHKKLETIKHTSVDDQIDCNIIFYDPYVEVISGQVKHAHDAHDQKFDDFESLINNVLIEAENQRMINKEMKKKNALITKELETYKERVQDLENKLVKNTNFKSEYGKLQN